MEFKLGDVVRLKSGSPNMTVVEISDTVYIEVTYWHEKLGEFKKQTFMADSLEKVE